MAIFWDVIASWVPRDARSILDVGCGRGMLGYFLRADGARRIEKLVGMEVDKDSLAFCKRHAIYDELVEWDLRRFPLPLEDKSFDVAVVSDVAEHLPDLEARRLISEVERVSLMSVLVVHTIPEDHEFASAKRRGSLPGPHDRHLTHFSVGELRGKGYHVRGLDRSKYFRTRRVSFVIENPFWFFPKLAGVVICKKGQIGSHS